MTDKQDLKSDFDYFLENKNELIQNPEYYGSFVAIKDKKIIEKGSNKEEVINKLSKKGLKIGEFII